MADIFTIHPQDPAQPNTVRWGEQLAKSLDEKASHYGRKAWEVQELLRDIRVAETPTQRIYATTALSEHLKGWALGTLDAELQVAA